VEDRETGSVLIQDTVIENTPTGIVTFPPTDKAASSNTAIVLDNVVFKSVDKAIVATDGRVWLPGIVESVDTFVIGPTYQNGKRDFAMGVQSQTPRQRSLVIAAQDGFQKPMYLENKRPQYEHLSASQFVSVKSQGAKGKSCWR
jgi:glucan 1,3-beta-glucosidase